MLREVTRVLVASVRPSSKETELRKVSPRQKKAATLEQIGTQMIGVPKTPLWRSGLMTKRHSATSSSRLFVKIRFMRALKKQKGKTRFSFCRKTRSEREKLCVKSWKARRPRKGWRG